MVRDTDEHENMNEPAVHAIKLSDYARQQLMALEQQERAARNQKLQLLNVVLNEHGLAGNLEVAGFDPTTGVLTLRQTAVAEPVPMNRA